VDQWQICATAVIEILINTEYDEVYMRKIMWHRYSRKYIIRTGITVFHVEKY
jgi:hypothetical protein